MARRNAFYARSGGISAVINASAYGVLVAPKKLTTVRRLKTMSQ
jgi:hypothetical protein